MSPGTITAAAEVRIFAYSGKLGLPPGVRASARRRPPMSAITGEINPRYPGKARIHRRASCSWIQIEASRVPAVPNSSVMQLRADLFESGGRQKAPLREPASMAEDPLHRAGPWWKQAAQYTHNMGLWIAIRVLSTKGVTEPSVMDRLATRTLQQAGSSLPSAQLRARR